MSVRDGAFSFMVTFDEVWQREFEPQAVAIRQRAVEHRTEAMLDVALTLCGEEVRQMTPHDMLHLDALGNPFIAGSPDGTVHFVDCVGFIWELHTANNHTNSVRNLWRRQRLVRRLAQQPLGAVVDAIIAFVDRMMLVESRPARPSAEDPNGDRVLRAQEPKTHFLAQLIASVAAEIGHIDPMSGQILAHTPIPRLKQYQMAADENKGGAKHYTEIDSLRNRCIERLNQLHAEERAASAIA